MKSSLVFIMILCSAYGFSQVDSLNNQLTYAFFKENLTEEMNSKEIIHTFGQPDSDIGSGLYIFQYSLADSTAVTIGCAQKVYYMRHLNSKGIRIDEIIFK